jgi:outer membrane protein assembly factor BamB
MFMKRRRATQFTSAGALGVVLLLGAHAAAVGTRAFELKRGPDFQGGELQGVSVDSTGAVRPGFDLGKVEIEGATTIWSALAAKDGSVLLGTGNEGKLLKVTGARVEVVAESGALAITSLAEAWGGAIVAATLPQGKVLKLAGGKLETLATLEGAEHVWQVAYDPKSKSLFAATGPEGKLYRIDANGTAQVYFDAPEEHLMSVAVAKDGTVYAGASDKAKLYRLSGPGRATVVHDFERTEVRAIAIGADGTVFAVANEIKPGSYTPRTKSSDAAGPAPKPATVKGKGVLVSISPEGLVEELLDDKEEHFVSLAVGDDGRPYVGTGVEGRVYTVDANHNRILVADAEERQITVLSVAGKQRFIASSDPAVFRPVRGVGGPDALWTSKVLDAGLRATFGRMRWESRGPIQISTRSGNTKEPDDTWSAWSAPVTRADLVKSPPARYLQLRARFGQDPGAELSELTIPFVTDNLRAVLTEVTAGSSSETQTGIQASGGPIEAKPSPTLALSWKVDNPDKDELRYRIEYRLIGTTQWFDVLPPRERLTKTSYSWNTSDMPEGRYRIRVTASDEISNPPGRAKQHELISDVLLIDNTPPVIEGLQLVGRTLRGTAVDGLGPISRIEVSVVGTDDWIPFFPRDGVFDEEREAFEIDLTSVAPAGPALVSIRVYDAANNAVVRNVTLR